MNTLNKEDFAFWDLIAQEAYRPKTRILQEGTWKRFCEKEKHKRIWLFACNAACGAFLEKYGGIWDIAGILDNSEAEWGKKFHNVSVYAPKDILPKLDGNKDVVILALRLNADIVAKQMIDGGFSNLYSLGVLLSGIEPYRTFVKEIRMLQEQAELSNMVLLESMNDFDGNSGALYEYLKKQGSKYRFCWICKTEEAARPFQDGGDICLYPERSLKDLKRYIYIRATAKWEIWECDPIRKVRKDQINVFLQHYGMGYKQVAHLYRAPDYVDFVLTTNSFVHKMESKSISYAGNPHFIYGELPRNDVFAERNWDELRKITRHFYKKTVMWAPTLRESRFYHRIDADITYPYGISLIYEKEDMERLNNFLSRNNMLLIIKIHPRQKINYEDLAFSNIIYLDGKSVKKVHAYKLLTQIDALITDYSSIVFDYMLLERPIAWVLEDRKHYKIEYLMEDPQEYMPGKKIYNMEDLFAFLTDVNRGIDSYAEERKKICEKCNPPFEGRGCESLVEKLGL